MKVTALIPDNLVQQITRHAAGKNLTESLILALKEWLSLKKIAKLNKQITAKPLEFHDGYSASKIRALNRKK